ncbi:MAG: hypothetical protein JXA92_07610 [candidate division Zixibacteria bacterium]|nr:hypothetical protein [candidate division Zixibacteria bacterium]
MRILLYPFMILAAVGLVLSTVVHISALLNVANPLGERTWLLHIGIFIVWLPAVLGASTLVRDFKRKNFWKATLRGCPKWMKILVYLFFGYAILNFIIFFILDVTDGNVVSDDSTPAGVFRGFSGHWMFFYVTAMALLYSAIKVKSREKTRKCVNGHAVSPLAKYCEICGARIIDDDVTNSYVEMSKIFDNGD